MYENNFELINVTALNATLRNKETNETKTWGTEKDPKKGTYAKILYNNRKTRVYLYKLTEEYKHRNETIAEYRKRNGID